MLDINKSCQTCHNVAEQELLDRVEILQQRTRSLLDRAASAMTDMLDAMRKLPLAESIAYSRRAQAASIQLLGRVLGRDGD